MGRGASQLLRWQDVYVGQSLVKGARVNLRLSRRVDRLLTLLLVLAFAVGGWKIFSRRPSANFAGAPRPIASPLQVAGDTPKAEFAASQPQQTSPDGKFRFDARFVSSAPGLAVHAASMVELRDGRLRAVWFSGSREGASDVTIQTAIMDAASLRWGPESTLFDRKKIEHGLWRYVKKLGNPVIARSPDGSIFMWMVNVSLGGWAGSSITWARSVDEGTSWSEPRRLVTSPFLNISTLVKGAPVAMDAGEVSLPIYHEFLTKFAEVLRVNTQGQVIDKIRIPGSQTSLQPVVLISGPERAQVYMRSSNARTMMTSMTADAGKTWSLSRAAAWPNPDSALAGLTTASGTQWLALNPTHAGREVLALLQAHQDGSFDGVSPWLVESFATPETGFSRGGYARLLDKELKASGASDAQAQAFLASATRQLCSEDKCAQEFSYPYLLQTSDGFIHLLYTWHRTRIKHVRFDPTQSALAAQWTPVNASPAN